MNHQRWGRMHLPIGLFLLAAIFASNLNAVEPLPYGHRDFVPTSERPVGYRADGSGHFPGATPPLTFNEKDGKNVRWSVKMPSWSQSSPIAVGKYVITTAEPDTTLCVDADTGKVLWQDALGLYESLVLDPNNPKETGKYCFLWSGHGYSWPCSDGERVFKKWEGGGNGTSALVCYALASGKRLWLTQFVRDWQKHGLTRDKAGKWIWKQQDGGWIAGGDGPQGYGSPLLYGEFLIYNNSNGLVALDKTSGALRWRSAPQVEGENWSDNNFIVVRSGQQDVLVTNLGILLDPKTGGTLGRAIPGTDKDGMWFSRLWGAMKMPERGERVKGKTPVSPVAGPDGLLAFGSAEGVMSAPDQPWTSEEGTGQRKGACAYLAVRLSLDAQGNPVSSCVFPERAAVPILYGMNHITLVKDRLVVMHGYRREFSAIDLASGKVVVTTKPIWEARKGGWPDVDWDSPAIKTALDEFGLTKAAVVGTDRSLGRDYPGTYSRCFVDGRGIIWHMTRGCSLYRLDPQRDFACELAGSLDNPPVWCSFSSPYPHGSRIYVRTFGRLACIGEK